MKKPSCVLSVLLLTALMAAGQKKNFTYEQAFRSRTPDFIKSLPDVEGWADDDHYIEMRSGGSKMVAMLVEAKSGKAVAYEPKNEPVVFAEQDDIFFTDGIQSPRQLTRSVEKEMNPQLSPDNKWVGYTRNNNLFALEVSTGKEIQFTTDGSELILNGYASWVYYEEILGRASRYKAFWWSPDSRHICFMRFDDTQVPMFPIYYAEGQHGFIERTHYPKVGDKNPETKLGIVSIDTPAVVWTDFNPKDDQYFGTPVWTPQGKLWVQWMPRSQDNLKVYEINTSNGSKKEVYDEKQQTWISLDDYNRFTFMEGTDKLIIRSDKTGWSHLYLHDLSGKLLNAITSGEYTVTDIAAIDSKAKQVYFNARKENSARTDLYRAGFDGKGLTRLSFGEYNHIVNASPSGKYFISMYSSLSTPPRLTLADGKGKIIRELGDSKGSGFDGYNIPKTELVRVKSQDGIFDLPMTITYPAGFDPAKKYPVLISIYGGPDAGTVYDTWKTTGNTAWWSQEGIIQVSMDNRSSGHFGKKGMNYIYRQLGKYEMEDYMQCARWLKQQSFVDGAKICITGTSFGGYLTCMALTYGASEFNYGVANASVTDWQLYDTHYTERFMDTPAENPEGYKNTAVLTHAGKYNGLLRIVHGSTDDNVHMQNSIQLIDWLEDKGKHFEFMLYPGERHGIGSNSIAKGLHNRTEAYRFYYRNLLNKELPEAFSK